MSNSAATREAVDGLLSALGSGPAPADLATRFSEDIDWRIPGDAQAAPWIAARQGRAGVAAFFGELRGYVTPQRFDVHQVFVDGDNAVIVGHLVSLVNATGRTIDSEFAITLTVRGGLITRYHLLEDSLAVYRAAQPSA